MEFIVDLQGFRVSRTGFRVKELAFIPRYDEEEQPSNLLFQPLFQWNLLPARQKSENLWLEQNFHSLTCVSGDVHYDDVTKIFTRLACSATKIYVQGLQKKDWSQYELLEVTRCEIIDLLDLGCPSLEKLKKAAGIASCTHHDIWNSNCEAQNVNPLQNWLLEHRAATKPGIDETDAPISRRRLILDHN